MGPASLGALSRRHRVSRLGPKVLFEVRVGDVRLSVLRSCSSFICVVYEDGGRIAAGIGETTDRSYVANYPLTFDSSGSMAGRSEPVHFA
jgi:hypothetical protein